MAAYYCFVNLGWPPSKYANMDFLERALIGEFINRDIRERKKEQDEIKRAAASKGKR